MTDWSQVSDEELVGQAIDDKYEKELLRRLAAGKRAIRERDAARKCCAISGARWAGCIDACNS